MKIDDGLWIYMLKQNYRTKVVQNFLQVSAYLISSASKIRAKDQITEQQTGQLTLPNSKSTINLIN